VEAFAAEVFKSATRMFARETMSRSTRRLMYWRWSGSEALEVREGSRTAEDKAVGGMGERESSWLK